MPSESRTAELCYSVYLSRKEELLKNGAKNTAYGTEDGQFTFAGNFGYADNRSSSTTSKPEARKFHAERGNQTVKRTIAKTSQICDVVM